MYNDEGNKEFEKGEFHNAVYFYTEGIKVECKDDELNAKLYRKRASAYKQIGKTCIRFRVIFLLYSKKQKDFYYMYSRTSIIRTFFLVPIWSWIFIIYDQDP